MTPTVLLALLLAPFAVFAQVLPNSNTTLDSSSSNVTITNTTLVNGPAGVNETIVATANATALETAPNSTQLSAPIKEETRTSNTSLLDLFKTNLRARKNLGVCSSDDDCLVPSSYCNTTSWKCVCVQGKVASSSNDVCLDLVYNFGDDCSEDSQCILGLKGAYGKVRCFAFSCTCASRRTFTNNTCLPEKGAESIGDACISDKDCPSRHTRCREGVCVCQDGMVPDPDERHCLAGVPEINKPCVESIQCEQNINNSICLRGQCACILGYHYNSTACVKVQKLDDGCRLTSECLVPSYIEPEKRRVCLNKVCSCAAGFVRVKKTDSCVAGASQITVSILLLTATIFGKILY